MRRSSHPHPHPSLRYTSMWLAPLLRELCTVTLSVLKPRLRDSILLYSILGCILPLQELVLHLSLIFAIPVHTAPCCPTMSSLQRRVGLPTDLTPFIYHSVLLIVPLSSFIRVMCPAHFHFILVTYWTMSITLCLCLMMALRILSFSLT